jgi:hypothetical protein
VSLPDGKPGAFSATQMVLDGDSHQAFAKLSATMQRLLYNIAHFQTGTRSLAAPQVYEFCGTQITRFSLPNYVR